MNIHKRVTPALIAVLTALALWLPQSVNAGLSGDPLNPEEISEAKAIIAKLAPLMSERAKKGIVPLLSFEELYGPLTPEEREFLKLFLELDAKKAKVSLPYRGFAAKGVKFVGLKGQKIKDLQGNPKTLDTQFLPADVYKKYTRMMKAMKKDIGKVLYVESGYRSAAYQLYLFVYYLKNHDYSANETAKFVAIAGYSEHGSPDHQALDFINSEGINGEDNPEQFEALEEYKWLMNNASRFGFVLSYPRNDPTGITFEPWHWRSDKTAR